MITLNWTCSGTPLKHLPAWVSHWACLTEHAQEHSSTFFHEYVSVPWIQFTIPPLLKEGTALEMTPCSRQSLSSSMSGLYLPWLCIHQDVDPLCWVTEAHYVNWGAGGVDTNQVTGSSGFADSSVWVSLSQATIPYVTPGAVWSSQSGETSLLEAT